MTNGTELTKNSTKKRRKNRSSKTAGLSMLEVILVLGFMGIVLLTIATLYRKYIDEKRRQIAADAIAQDVAGLLKFVHTDVIDTQSISNIKILDNNGKEKAVPSGTGLINPLYQQAGASPLLHYQVTDLNKGLANNPLVKVKAGTSPQMSPGNKNLLVYMGRYFPKPDGSINNDDNNTTDGNPTVYSYSLNWSEVLFPGEASHRRWFTDSRCENGNQDVVFGKPFLTCHENPTLANSEITISRVELVNSQGTLLRTTPASTHVDSVNVYISFTPVDGNPAHIWQYVTPLMKAFDKLKIQPNSNERYLVVRNGNVTDNKWSMVSKDNAQGIISAPADGSTVAKLEDIPSIAGRLNQGANRTKTYALRFTFDGTGGYLHTDGSNFAEKLCWNALNGTAGPCLEAPDEKLLALTTRDRDMADFQAGSLVSEAVNMVVDGKGNFVQQKEHGRPVVAERYTVPRIQYRNFSNTNTNTNGRLKPVYQNKQGQMCQEDGKTCDDGPTIGDITKKGNGVIEIDVQRCPQVWDPQADSMTELHPRVSVAVSSVISGLFRDETGAMGKGGIKSDLSNLHIGDMFSSQAQLIDNLNTASPRIPENQQARGNSLSVNRLGGVVFQIVRATVPGDPQRYVWHIGSIVYTEDAAEQGKTWLYFNPPWLSAVVTTWCSDQEQDQPHP